MEGRSRRQFLREAASGVLGLYGVSEAKKAEAGPRRELETQRERVMKKIDELISENLPWLKHEAYARAEKVEGKENVENWLKDQLIRRDPTVFVFGEHHDVPAMKTLGLDLMEEMPRLQVVAEEAFNHRTEERMSGHLSQREFSDADEEAILNPPKDQTASPKHMLSQPSYRRGNQALAEQMQFKRRFEDIVKRRDISISLLHHPFDTRREVESKVFGLLDEGEQAMIYAGAHHAMMIPGEKGRSESDSTYVASLQEHNVSTFGVSMHRNVVSLEQVRKKLFRYIAQEIKGENERYRTETFSGLRGVFDKYNGEIRKTYGAKDGYRLYAFSEEDTPHDDKAMLLYNEAEEADDEKVVLDADIMEVIFVNAEVLKLLQASKGVRGMRNGIILFMDDNTAMIIEVYKFQDEFQLMVKRSKGRVVDGKKRWFIDQFNSYSATKRGSDWVYN